MKKPALSFLLLLLMFSTQAKQEASEESKHKAQQWGYEGESGPKHWGEMSDTFKLCSAGENQSPIDIHSEFDVALAKINFDYTAKATKILNNGHTIQVDISVGSSISVAGNTFELKQFHFHTPSENNIKGKSYPLEAHFVHRNAANNTFAVVAVMFEEGETNATLEAIWSKMPASARQSVKLEKALDYSQLLPKDQDYYRFNGSFTTPPCTEGVYWHVMKKPLSASKAQIAAFLAVMHHPNNRDIQKTGARVIIE